MEAPDLKCPLGLRDRALLEMLYGGGLRVNELVQLDLWDLDLSAGYVRVLGKKSKERLVPLGSQAIKALQNYLVNARPGILARAQGKKIDNGIFLNYCGERLSARGIRKILNKYARETKLTKGEPPPCAIPFYLLNAGRIYVRYKTVGHARLSNTDLCHVTSEKLKQVSSAHPRAKKKPDT